ncbi:hypothetical protein DFH27DRAFT_548735 [Peziza echinospora]|nr:hypothetical protein DFH27DRAFT_548735 [Peziza echinospora]
MAVRPKTANPSTTAKAPTYISTPGQPTTLKKPSRRPRAARGASNHPLVAPKRNAAPRIDAVNPSKKDENRLRELEKHLPNLNMIVPAGVVKPSGKKRGKVFVEDKQTMVEILKLVNETREKVVEKKLDRGRQLEALREERRREQDERDRARKEKLDSAKDSVRRKRKSSDKDGEGMDASSSSSSKSKKKKPTHTADGKLKLTKKVSFR